MAWLLHDYGRVGGVQDDVPTAGVAEPEIEKPRREPGLKQKQQHKRDGAIMQNNTVNVNAQCSLSPDELETLLRAAQDLSYDMLAREERIMGMHAKGVDGE